MRTIPGVSIGMPVMRLLLKALELGQIIAITLIGSMSACDASDVYPAWQD
jgi:hypothetical protein